MRHTSTGRLHGKLHPKKPPMPHRVALVAFSDEFYPAADFEYGATPVTSKTATDGLSLVTGRRHRNTMRPAFFILLSTRALKRGLCCPSKSPQRPPVVSRHVPTFLARQIAPNSSDSELPRVKKLLILGHRSVSFSDVSTKLKSGDPAKNHRFV